MILQIIETENTINIQPLGFYQVDFDIAGKRFNEFFVSDKDLAGVKSEWQQEVKKLASHNKFISFSYIREITRERYLCGIGRPDKIEYGKEIR